LQVKVPVLDVQQTAVQTIDIGQVAIGPITVGSLVVNNTNAAISAGQGVLTNVRVTVTIGISVEWHVHVGLPDGIPNIDIGDTYNLGSISFGPVSVGNIVIPGLSNVHLNVPNLAAQNMSAAASPLGLQLHNAIADDVHATNFALPSAGFTISGLTLGSIQGNNLGIPAANLAQATVAHVHGDAVHIPSLTLNNLTLPSAQILSLSTTAPLDIPANLPTQSPGFDAGILRLYLHLTPSALSHIDQVQITNATANATVGQVVLQNVTVPYDVLNLTLSQVGITTINVPAFNVS
jgi:hypothetical protein